MPEILHSHLGGNQPIHQIIMPLATQVAGHGSEGDYKRAILKRISDGMILKPVQPPPKGERESMFYRQINESTDPIDQELKNYIPEFFGVEKINIDKDFNVKGDYLVLRDITEKFRKPSIMDVKIGAKTYGPDASSSKIAQEDSKYLGTKGPFGYSVLGMIVHSIKNDDPVKKYDKSFGMNLDSKNIEEVLKIFFDAHDGKFIPELVELVLDQVERIREMFEKQRKYKLYASSLLLAYDAFAVREYLDEKDEKVGKDELSKHVAVRLIDFAHVFPADGEKDENFLFGLTNFIQLLQSCLKNEQSKLLFKQ